MAATPVLTLEITIVLVILCVAVFLFVSEWVRIDVGALLIMLLIGSADQISGIKPLIGPDKLFSGFSSNAVISIIAIMVLSTGLDKSEVMSKVASLLLAIGKHTERRIVARISLTIGLISAFMQNVGATALFLPVISRIANRTEIPLSKLLMPTRSCAILGGTLTMIGCSSLIILNDLILSFSHSIDPQTQAIYTFSLFEVAPIGLMLLLTGVVFFVFVGTKLLPAINTAQSNDGNPASYLAKIYGIQSHMFEALIPENSPIAGKTIRQIEDTETAPHILSISSNRETQMSPNRDEIIWPNSKLLVLGNKKDTLEFSDHNSIIVSEIQSVGAHLLSDTREYRKSSFHPAQI